MTCQTCGETFEISPYHTLESACMDCSQFHNWE